MSDLPSRLPSESELAEVEALLSKGPPTLALQFRQAVLLHNLGRLDEAKAVYLGILKIDSTHLPLLNNFASLLHEMEFRRAAITVYERILQLYPDQAACHVNLANVLWDHADHAGALLHYQAALGIDPDCIQAHQGMTCALLELRQDKAAWVHGQKGFALRPIQVLPYRGNREPISVLVLISVAGGNTPLRKAIDNRVFMTTLLATEFHDSKASIPAHQVVWNAIGDAERCGKALAIAENLLKNAIVPIINRPEIMSATGRVDNARQLTRIKNLLIPKTVRIRRKVLERNDIRATLEALGFGFPFLLRAQGFHGGKHFMKIDGFGDLTAALESMPGREFSVIQFLDTRGADGKYRKYRVMVIDGKFYPLHAAVSSNWKIHYFSADMAENAEHRNEDGIFLSDMPRVLGHAAMQTIADIRDALRLDYFGIDFSLTTGGEVVFFEANATMNIVQPEAGEKWDYRRTAVQKALDAVTSMLLSRIKAAS